MFYSVFSSFRVQIWWSEKISEIFHMQASVAALQVHSGQI